jgi:hypothetical protein
MLNQWLIPHQTNTGKNATFDPNDTEIIKINSLENCTFPAICLIGVDEKTAQPIKDELYELPLESFKIPVYDLGNLWNHNEEDLVEFMSLILTRKLTPIFIGEKSTLFHQMFMALEKVFSPFNFSICESMVGRSSSFIADEKNPFINENLIQGSIIGFQSHLSNQKHLDSEVPVGVEYLRLGVLRNNMDLAEALIRNSDGFCFNSNSLRYSDFPAQLKPNSCGLSAEEACQLFYYAGNNEKMKTLCMAGISIELDDRNVSAYLAAQMIWYFIDGFQKRKYTFSYPGWEKDSLIEYVVDIKDWENPLTFLKSQTTNKWWFKLPENDGNVPDRIINAIKLYELKLQL